MVAIAPHNALIPDALELPYLGRAYPVLDRLAMDALKLSIRLDVAERLEQLALDPPLARRARVALWELAAAAASIRATLQP